MNEQITFRRVVRAEWTKLISLRSTWLTLASVSVLTIGLAGAMGYGVNGSVADGEPPPSVSQAVASAFLPLDFFILIIGVFGVLQMSGEYHGAIRATLTAVPRRHLVVGAKAAVLTVVAVPVMAVVALASFLTCQAFLGDAGASLGDAGVARAIVGAVAAPVLIAVLGLGIGTLLRNTAGAITTLVALLYVIPALLGPALPGDREDDILKFVPTIAGQAMYGSLGGENSPFETLSPGMSAAVLAVWALLLLIGGVAMLARRDA